MNDQALTTGNADVVDRLARLRAVVPLMARDLAAARRRISELELVNQRLTRRVHDLESMLPDAQRTRNERIEAIRADVRAGASSE